MEAGRKRLEEQKVCSVGNMQPSVVEALHVEVS